MGGDDPPPPPPPPPPKPIVSFNGKLSGLRNATVAGSQATVTFSDGGADRPGVELNGAKIERTPSFAIVQPGAFEVTFIDQSGTRTQYNLTAAAGGRYTCHPASGCR